MDVMIKDDKVASAQVDAIFSLSLSLTAHPLQLPVVIVQRSTFIFSSLLNHKLQRRRRREGIKKGGRIEGEERLKLKIKQVQQYLASVFKNTIPSIIRTNLRDFVVLFLQSSE